MVFNYLGRVKTHEDTLILGSNSDHIFNSLTSLYALVFTLVLITSLGSKKPTFITKIGIILNICLTYLLIYITCAMMYALKPTDHKDSIAIAQFSIEKEGFWDFGLPISTTFIMTGVTAFVFLDPWHLLFIIQYISMLPTYFNVIVVHACNNRILLCLV